VNTLSTTQPHHPTTFQERGVMVPFTTPLLAGARARLAGRPGVELILHNPAGGRGVYVMPWSGITALCRPTLHDKVLNGRIGALRDVTPATIRHAARLTAAEGLAGEQAMEAAELAIATEKSDRLATHGELLLILLRQVNREPHVSSAAAPPDLDKSARQAIAWLAPHLGMPASRMVEALDAISDVMAGVGMASGGEAGRIPRLVRMLRQTRDDIGEWAPRQPGENLQSGARTVSVAADLMLSRAATLLGKSRAMAVDMIGLSRLWNTDPEAVIRLAARPEWLLDGWEQICLIWRYARDDAGRRAALAEIADHVPVMPRQLSEWSGCSLDLNDPSLAQRPLQLNRDWRTGAAVFDLIARNEQFRAVAI
jgi:hypothetical protein